MTRTVMVQRYLGFGILRSSRIRPLPLAHLGAILASPHRRSDLFADADLPLLVVDVDASTVDAATGRSLRGLPVVTVAVASEGAAVPGPGLEDFDLLLTDAARPEATVELVARQVAANPIASVALVQLLRLSEHLGVVDGLAAESFTYSTLQAGPEFARWIAAHDPAKSKAVNPEPLLVERDGATLGLTFCRPEIRNAYGFEVRDALVEALHLAAADPSIETVLLRGEGPSFCSGGDLREFGTAVDPATAHRIRTTRSAAFWLDRVRDRLRAEIHGDCVGSGIELPAFAGRVVAAADLRVHLPEVSMGLVPGAGGTVSLPRRIGRQRTGYLALTGAPIDAATALAWGLVDEVV